jgi:hypothetical protein
MSGYYSHLKHKPKRKIMRNENWVVYYPHQGGTFHTVVQGTTINDACDRFDRENPHVKCFRPEKEVVAS